MAEPVFLEAKEHMRVRMQYAQSALERAVKEGADTSYDNDFSAEGRVRRFGRNGTFDYWVVPLTTVISYGFRANFSWKRGPFVEYLTSKDLRSVQPKLAALEMPATAKLGALEVPGQTAGVRFGMYSFTRYSASLVDLIGSQVTYRSLRRDAQLVRKKKGVVEVDYGAGIRLTIRGILDETSGVINADLKGFPSRGREKVIHNTHYKLEVVRGTEPHGIFNITSGYDQIGVANHDVWLHRRGRLEKSEAEKTREGNVDRVALGLGDLVGLRMINRIASKMYGVQVNQPLPTYTDEMVLLAERIGNRAIFVSPSGKRKKPNKTQWNMLLSTALASPARGELLLWSA